MRSELALAMVCMTAAIIGVRFIEHRYPARSQSDETIDVAQKPPLAPNASVAALSPYKPGWRKEVRVMADHDRQFRISADVNRQSVHFLIDTGAAFVALRESDARRANIVIRREDFSFPVSTANGVTNAARVRIEDIEINGLRVRDVDAFILPDDLLGMNLLGMSFLSQLPSVEARGAELILRG